MKTAAKSALLCALLTSGAAILPLGAARAQTVFSTIQAFGDSYADTGNLFRLLGVPNPVQYPTGRFSGGTNFVDTTSLLLNIPQANFAVGGSQTAIGPVPGSGFTQVTQAFVASGK